MRQNYKELNRAANILGYDIVRHEELGNAKAPYYRYSLVTADTREWVKRKTTLKDINKFLLEVSKIYMEGNNE